MVYRHRLSADCRTEQFSGGACYVPVPTVCVLVPRSPLLPGPPARFRGHIWQKNSDLIKNLYEIFQQNLKTMIGVLWICTHFQDKTQKLTGIIDPRPVFLFKKNFPVLSKLYHFFPFQGHKFPCLNIFSLQYVMSYLAVKMATLRYW